MELQPKLAERTPLEHLRVTKDAPLPVPVRDSKLLPEIVALRRDVMQRTSKAGDDRTSFLQRTALGRWFAGTAAGAGAAALVSYIGWAKTAPQTWTDYGGLQCMNDLRNTHLPLLNANDYALGVHHGDALVYSARELANIVCEVPDAATVALTDMWSTATTASLEVGAAAALASVAVVGLRWLANRKNTEKTLPVREIEPLQIAFADAAHDPAKREAIRLLANEVFEDMKSRGVRGPEARQAVAAIIETKDPASTAEQNLASVVSSIIARMLTRDGKVLPLAQADADFITMNILGLATEDDQRALRQQIRETLFTPAGRYRGQAERAVEINLLDFLLGTSPSVYRS